MVPRQHLLADVSGAYNAIAVQGEALGASMYFGLGAGMMPTATAVVADLMDVARNLLGGSRGRVAPLGYPLAQQQRVPLKSIDDLISEYYLRFMVVDRPGVLAKISGIQKEREHGASVPIVIRTHQALERNLRKALKAIDRLPAVRAKSALIRIEDSLGQ
jgi:homoserine dehydrogenase